MAFRKKGRSGYYVRPTLTGIGRVGPWATGTTNKALAKAMESALQELAIAGQHDLIQLVINGEVRLPDLYSAKVQGRLNLLREHANDPPLRSVIARVKPMISDGRVTQGLEQLERGTPPKARLSWLMEPKNVTSLLAAAVAAGRKPNSVKRSLYRAVSDLLTIEIGKSRRMQVLAEVRIPSEDDARDITLTRAQVAQLLEHCDAEIRDIVAVAILTGVDRSPLVLAAVRDYDQTTSTLNVRDKKTTSRPRRLELSAAAAGILARACEGKVANESIFGLTSHTVRKRFEAAREAAGMPWLRFKDLRHVFASHWVETGGTLKDLGRTLGHVVDSTTLRYTAHQAVKQRAQMDTVARSVGLDSLVSPLEPEKVA